MPAASAVWGFFIMFSIPFKFLFTILYLGLTQKAALPLFEGFAKQNLPQTRQKDL
jgi:hypothetical protein